MSATVLLDSVTVDFPIFDGPRSFRGELKNLVGGLIHGGASRSVTVRALDDIHLKLVPGDRLAIVGHNGAGKSTLLKVCAGVYEPTAGTATVLGRVSSLLNIAPGLEPDDSGLANIRTCGRFLGMTSAELDRKVPAIAEYTELGDYLALPVRTYSTGMVLRLCFAIATALDPEILILDEGLSSGDARFTERAKARIDGLVSRSKVLILASHSEALLRELCNRAILLRAGRLVAEGSVDEIWRMHQQLVD